MKTKIALISFALTFALACTAAECMEARYYGEAYRGKPMAWHALPYNPDGLTCSTYRWPLGTWLRVTCNGRSVVVRNTDHPGESELDLSRRAFLRLANLSVGKITVCVSEVSP